MPLPLTLHLDPVGDVLDAARDCELAVFGDVYGNTHEQWHEEYGPFDRDSVFLAVTTPAGDAVAAMRIVRPGPVGLKSVIDTARPPWFVAGERAARAAGLDLARTWDVATLSFRRGFRDVPAARLAPVALYHGLFHAARANDARWIVAILDVRVRRLLNALSIDTQLLPGCRPGPYLGSEASAPLWGDLPAMADRQRRVAPDAHRLVNLGVGLDGITLPTDWTLRPAAAAARAQLDAPLVASAGAASTPGIASGGIGRA